MLRKKNVFRAVTMMVAIFFVAGSSNLCYSEYRNMMIQYLNHNSINSDSTAHAPSPTEKIVKPRENIAHAEEKWNHKHANHQGLTTNEDNTLFVEMVVVEPAHETSTDKIPQNKPASNVSKLPRFFLIKTVDTEYIQTETPNTLNKE